MSSVAGLMQGLDFAIGELRKGNLYAIATRCGGGKSHFCIGVASHFTRIHENVLYVSDSMDRETFYGKMNKVIASYGGDLVFKECYKLTIDKLENWLELSSFGLLVIDPFDIFSWDLDIGELKELALRKNIRVLLSKNITKRTPLDSNPPSLSQIRFPSKQIEKKFWAYVDVVLMAYQTLPPDDFVTFKVCKGTAATWKMRAKRV